MTTRSEKNSRLCADIAQGLRIRLKGSQPPRETLFFSAQFPPSGPPSSKFHLDSLPDIWETRLIVGLITPPGYTFLLPQYFPGVLVSRSRNSIRGALGFCYSKSPGLVQATAFGTMVSKYPVSGSFMRLSWQTIQGCSLCPAAGVSCSSVYLFS